MRKFELPDFKGRGDQVVVGTDASPFGLPLGLGGWLSINGVINKHFCYKVTDYDLELFNITRGSCDGQQVLECLAVLVALKAWLPTCEQRIQLKVKLDNVTALTLVLKIRPKTAALMIIARELALLLIHFSFPPAVVHTPGISHKIADALSRTADVSKPAAKLLFQHPAFTDSVLTSTVVRDPSFYKALVPFQSSQSK